MKLSILLASYGPQSQMYLNMCYRSLDEQSFKDFELIHISSGDFKPENLMGAYNFKGTHYHSDERLHFPAAIAKAYEMSSKSSDAILLLNDDVIMQKDCLKKLYDTINMAPMCIINPRSNCDDNGRFYLCPSKFNQLQYRAEQMSDLFYDVVNYLNELIPFMLVRQDQVHFYCSMMKRSTWEDVGGIDTILKTGFDDADFCLRAKQKGYSPMIAMHAYALHGSGVSADLYLSPEDRAFNERYYLSKHGEGQR